MSIFRFKKFLVHDDRATMKVGTDAVLLGSWAEIENASNMLDIGTGTGILALMLAQRSPESTYIDAVELAHPDAQQAIENVRLSPWPEKINVIHSDIRLFQHTALYDLIICNPPYFINSLLPPQKGRETSRHTTAFSHDDLLEAVRRLMSREGRLNVILPFIESEIFIKKAVDQKLVLRRNTQFFTRQGKPQERALMEFRFTSGPLENNSVTLYGSGLEWTKEYRGLTSDFYLDHQK
ncbi:MAG TPA: methyltransferase [Cyclobacteriaceae bacterium]|nr:methyltransferase [Cyclobacteriaceae bacterium]